MAHKKDSKEPESKAAAKKLRGIFTHRSDDGGFVHEHHYHGEGEAPRYGGVSTSMEDLHRHMDDHFGETADSPQEPQEAPEGPEAPAEAAEPQQAPPEPQQ